jgi:hypothetical protein
MAVTWMKAAEQNGIPTAFLVNRQGRIAWIGHPMELDEKLLNDVLANRHDTAKAATEFAQREQNQQQLKELFKKFSASLKAENWSEAEAAVTEIEKLLPADQREGAGPLRLQIFLGRKDYVGFYKLAAAFSDAHPSNVSLQNDLAWFIVTQPDLPQRDLALAARCAERANQASQGKEPAILDTLARVQFMSGKTNEAVATELKAVNLAKDQEKGGLEKSLADYRAGKLPEIK